MKKIVSLSSFLVAFLFCVTGYAQDAEMADGMRASGKIYVVVGIILIVLVGLIAYLFLLDKKLTRLENQLNAGNKPKH
ncbi:MAG TPA: CcmD family protein [Chryseosolibacter sp.]